MRVFFCMSRGAEPNAEASRACRLTLSPTSQGHLVLTRIQSATPVCATIAVIAAVILAAFMLVAAMPSAARADDQASGYACSQLSIAAQVQTDGSLHVVEQHALDFDDPEAKTKSSAPLSMKRILSDQSNDISIKINSVRIVYLNDEGMVIDEWKTLESAPFQIDWRDKDAPSQELWSFDRAEDAIHAYFAQRGSSAVLEFDYTIDGAVVAYDDIAELTWEYVSGEQDEAIDDVSLSFELPVPSGEAVVAGDNVQAWGHGPRDGVVSVNEDATVTYEIAHVEAGQYAQAHVVFPVSWLSNLSRVERLANQGTVRLDNAVSEERSWVDTESTQHIFVLTFDLVTVLACMLVLVICLILFWHHSRMRMPDFTERYWRDVPTRGVPPALIGRLWRWNHHDTSDFTATIMDLARRGVVRIESVGSLSEKEREILLADTSAVGHVCKGDYVIRRTDQPLSSSASTSVSSEPQPFSPLEVQALKLLFDDIGAGRAILCFSDIQQFAEEEPQTYLDLMRDWQNTLSAEIDARGFFEHRGKRLQVVIGVIAAIFIVVGIISALAGNFFATACLVLTGLVLVVIANDMPQRSAEGNNIMSYAEALVRWMKDISLYGDLSPESIDDRCEGLFEDDLSDDEALWEELILYACLFGLSERSTVKILRIVFARADCRQAKTPVENTTVPTHHIILIPQIYAMLNNSVSKGQSLAQNAVSQAHARMSGAGRTQRDD